MMSRDSRLEWTKNGKVHRSYHTVDSYFFGRILKLTLIFLTFVVDAIDLSVKLRCHNGKILLDKCVILKISKMETGFFAIALAVFTVCSLFFQNNNLIEVTELPGTKIKFR